MVYFGLIIRCPFTKSVGSLLEVITLTKIQLPKLTFGKRHAGIFGFF